MVSVPGPPPPLVKAAMYQRPGRTSWSYAMPVRFRGGTIVHPDGEVKRTWRAAMLYVHLDQDGKPASLHIGAMA